jgi:hypothetical protein
MVPDIETVDVAELEPAMLHVAEVSAAANRDALHNPRVHVMLGDAREALLTSRSTYDIVVSEPSNPYRAGVASLFTQEYYQAIRDRLSEDGLFLQWLQAYAIDVPTTRTVYATIGAVFPEIETWELGANDLVLVASRKPVRYDLPRLRDRVGKEPFRGALLHTWRTTGIDGLFSHYVARGSFARALAHSAGPLLNTDDRSIVEFAFARTARDFQGGSVTDIRDVARARGEHLPRLLDKHVDWERSTDDWMAFRASEGAEIRLHSQMTEGQRVRAYALVQFANAHFPDVIAQWRLQARDPSGPTELAVLAVSNAELADDAALPYIDQLRAFEPVEADAILARLRLRQGKLDQATDALVSSFIGYRSDLWAWPIVMNQALETAKELGQRHPPSMSALRRGLSQPFACSMFDEGRNEALLTLVRSQEIDATCVDALRPFEPYFPWIQDLLAWRVQCYDLVHHAEASRATRELKEFSGAQPMPIGDGLLGR